MKDILDGKISFKDLDKNMKNYKGDNEEIMKKTLELLK